MSQLCRLRPEEERARSVVPNKTRFVRVAFESVESSSAASSISSSESESEEEEEEEEDEGAEADEADGERTKRQISLPRT